MASTLDPANVDAVILVGGQGTRLRPLTLSAPKPMLPTAGLPFLTHLLSRIAAAGIQHVVLGTSYKAEVFEAAFGDGSKLGLEIEYVVEEEALGTGGGIANVAPQAAPRHRAGVQRRRALRRRPGRPAGQPRRPSGRCDPASGAGRAIRAPSGACPPTPTAGSPRSWRRRQDPPTDQINAGLLRLPPRDHRPRSPRAGRCRWSARCSRRCSPTGSKVCGYVDATYWRDMGTPDDFVRGSAGPGPRYRAVARAAAVSAASTLGARRCGRRAGRAADRRDRGRPRSRDRCRRPAGRCGHLRRCPGRGRGGDRAVHHRVRRPHRAAGADPRRCHR